MPSNKKSLSEEQIFADIMEMISSSNKKSKNVKSSSKNNENKKTKNVKNKKNSKKNFRGGFAPVDGSADFDLSNLASIMGDVNENSLNKPGRGTGINVDSQGVQSNMGNSGGVAPGLLAGGKPKKRRVVKKSGAKKTVKKSGVKKRVVKKVGAKKRVVKKVGAKKVKKVGTKKRVAKKVGAKKVAKKSKRVAKK